MTSLPATILIKKWKRAAREHGPAAEAFEDLCRVADADVLGEWRAAADAADASRDSDPTAMDIYDVSAQPCEWPNPFSDAAVTI